jgi:hypothetical protein
LELVIGELEVLVLVSSRGDGIVKVQQLDHRWLLRIYIGVNNIRQRQILFSFFFPSSTFFFRSLTSFLCVRRSAFEDASFTMSCKSHFGFYSPFWRQWVEHSDHREFETTYMRLKHYPSVRADDFQNDDGFGTANIREMYKAVKAYGHEAYIVASADNQSGKGGTVTYTTSRNLTVDSEFGT